MIPGPPTVRRRKRLGLRLLLAIVLLGALLVAADRVAVVVAQRMAADTLQQSQQLAQRPEVSIHGFPFLTQLAARTFAEVEVRLDDVPVGRGDRALTVADLHLTLRQVHVSTDLHRATARSGRATASISYGELSRVLGLRLSYAGAGRVAATVSIEASGSTVTGRVSAKPVLGEAELRFTDVHATVDGANAPDAAALLGTAFAHGVDLSGLPFGLQVRGFAAGPGGVSISLAATGLSFRRPA